MAKIKVTAKQVYEYTNNATKEMLGDSPLIAEDLSNVIDIGTSLDNIDGAYVTYVNNLILAYGKEIYVNRPYKADTLNIVRDNVEYGQLIAKYRTKLDEAMPNQSWQLQHGASYDDNQFIETDVEVEIFTQRDAYEIRKSLTDEQIRGAFKSPEALTRFTSMVFTMVYNSIEVKRASLVKAVVNNFIAEVRNINKATQNIKLLTEYNTLFGTTLTRAQAYYSKEFFRYATSRILYFKKQLTEYKSIYNAKGTEVFTPSELQHLVLLDKFKVNAEMYLDSDTFHDEFVKMPYHETVASWQAAQADDSVKVAKTASGATNIAIDGVIGVLFDHDALGMNEDSPTTRTHYVNSAEFTNYWFKQKVGYFNSLDENFILFTLE